MPLGRTPELESITLSISQSGTCNAGVAETFLHTTRQDGTMAGASVEQVHRRNRALRS